MKKATPKLPKSVLDKVQNKGTKKDIKNSKEPQTADEFLEAGIEEEESADRWYSADLAKSLRFYERAYEAYQRSIQLDPTSLDSYYNLSRLLFHVYNSFTKLDQINLGTLANVENCFGNVVQELPAILQYFEYAFDKFRARGRNSWDLIFNYALVYQEMIDSDTSSDLSIEQIVDLGTKSAHLYQLYLDHQLSELSEITNLGNEDEETGESNGSDDDIAEFEVITPTAILDSVISAYRLVQSVYEFASSSEEIMFINTNFNGFLESIKAKAESVVKTDFPNFETHSDAQFNTDVQELRKLDEFVRFFNVQSLSDVLKALRQDQDSQSANFEFFLSANDLLLSLIPNATTEQSQLWEAYSLVSSFFKKAQDILQEQLQNLTSTSELYSPKISLLVSVLINRSDSEFQRSKIAVDDKNKTALLNNVKTLLKNAITWSKRDGGLRENVVDKLNRFYLQQRANIRLALIEGTEFQTNNADLWTSEIGEIRELYGLQN